MSLSVDRSEGRTVLTLTSDPSSACPPLCQLLRAQWSSSRCLPSPCRGAQAALGALWILTAVLHIGLGSVLITSSEAPVVLLWSTFFPVWVGVMFLFLGVCCIQTERRPGRPLVLLNAILNLMGVALSIVALIVYAFTLDTCLGHFARTDRCKSYWDRPVLAALSWSGAVASCKEALAVRRALTLSVCAALIALPALDLCLGLGSALLSLRALDRGTGEGGGIPLPQRDGPTPTEPDERQERR